MFMSEDGQTKMQPLDLLELEVDSIEGFGGLVDFDFDGLFINFDFPQVLNVGDTVARHSCSEVVLINGVEYLFAR